MKLQCLVDNAVAPLSPFWGEHGLAFLIETDEGARLLFDTGASGTVLLHNLERAGVGLDTIDALVLSHSHPDHTGGLPAILKQREGIPVHAHPELLRPRYSQKDGAMNRKWLPMHADALEQRADLRTSESPTQVLPGLWTTGEILKRNEPEGRSPHHFVRDGEHWVPDPYRDDLSLVLATRNGPFVVCGCCHAGLLNTLAQVRSQFGTNPIGVAGGTHLVGAGPQQLAHTVEKLSDLGSPALHLNHCTGTPALVSLSHAFGDRVSHCPAGTTLEL